MAIFKDTGSFLPVALKSTRSVVRRQIGGLIYTCMDKIGWMHALVEKCCSIGFEGGLSGD